MGHHHARRDGQPESGALVRRRSTPARRLGAAAFGFIVPITIAMVAVLAILLFSYRQTIKAYPSADGAYIVTKDNLGLLPARVAGAAALYSAVPSMYAWRVPITLVFIALIARGNLRGASPNNSPRYRT